MKVGCGEGSFQVGNVAKGVGPFRERRWIYSRRINWLGFRMRSLELMMTEGKGKWTWNPPLLVWVATQSSPPSEAEAPIAKERRVSESSSTPDEYASWETRRRQGTGQGEDRERGQFSIISLAFVHSIQSSLTIVLQPCQRARVSPAFFPKARSRTTRPPSRRNRGLTIPLNQVLLVRRQELPLLSFLSVFPRPGGKLVDEIVPRCDELVWGDSSRFLEL